MLRVLTMASRCLAWVVEHGDVTMSEMRTARRGEVWVLRKDLSLAILFPLDPLHMHIIIPTGGSKKHPIFPVTQWWCLQLDGYSWLLFALRGLRPALGRELNYFTGIVLSKKWECLVMPFLLSFLLKICFHWGAQHGIFMATHFHCHIHSMFMMSICILWLCHVRSICYSPLISPIPCHSPGTNPHETLTTNL